MPRVFSSLLLLSVLAFLGWSGIFIHAVHLGWQWWQGSPPLLLPLLCSPLLLCLLLQTVMVMQLATVQTCRLWSLDWGVISSDKAAKKEKVMPIFPLLNSLSIAILFLLPTVFSLPKLFYQHPLCCDDGKTTLKLYDASLLTSTIKMEPKVRTPALH